MTARARPSRLGRPPPGTLWVGAASVLLGASGYAFLTLTARRLEPSAYAALASLYLLVALIGPGLFLPIEAETTKLVSRAQALGVGTRDELRRLRTVCLVLAAAAVVALVAFYPVLVRRVFHGHAGLWFALTASVLGYAGASVWRGLFAGVRHYRGYGAAVGVDGLVRLVGCGLLAALGVATVVPYGFALGLGAVFSFLAVRPWARPGSPGPATPWRPLLRAVASLVAAWGLSLTLANLAPVVVTALLPNDPRRAGIFAFVFVVARVPVFVLLSLQAIILPTLSTAAARSDHGAMDRGIRGGVAFVAALGVFSVTLTPPVCEWLVGQLFRTGDGPTTGILTALAIGSILAMLIQVLQPALIAIDGHHMVAVAWLLGAIAFAACLAVPVDPVVRATAAQVAGGLVTAAVMLIGLRHRIVNYRSAPDS